MALTDDDLVVAWDAYALRMKGKAFAVKPEFVPNAERLVDRGWLSRRVQDGDVIFEFTDKGMAALDMRRNLDAYSTPN